MTSIPAVPDGVFHDAVRQFWDQRLRQAEDQRSRGAADQGERAAVTGGQQLNGFIAKMVELAEAAGVRFDEVLNDLFSQGSRQGTLMPGLLKF